MKKIKTETKEMRSQLLKINKKPKSNEITFDQFKMFVRQLYFMEKMLILFKNQRRAAYRNNILRNSSYWEQLVEMRRNENSEENKKEVAALEKLGLVEALNKNSYISKEITRDNVNDFINEKIETDHSINPDSSIVQMEVSHQRRLDHVVKYMEEEMPIFEWCKRVKGLGYLGAAKLLSIIGDIQRFEKPSQLCSYCGYGDASQQVRQKGVQMRWNHVAKVLLHIIAENMVIQNSQYRVIFDKRKEKTLKTHPEWHNLNPDGTPNEGKNLHPKHAYIDARRVMIKRFLMELYDAWYKSIGIDPPSKPYGAEIKGHHVEEQIVPYKKSIGA